MIPEHKRRQLADDLVALGGTPDQVSRIGSMCFTVCALDSSRDAEYLLSEMQDEDPLIRKAARLMLDTLT